MTCFPINYSISSFWERELFEFIYENFTWKIISWSRILWDEKNKYKKEIDIHLIHKNIWFEYNWSYWHWSEESIKRDNEKIEMSKRQWIKLYIVKEEDWKWNKQKEKERVIQILKNEWIYSPRNIKEIDLVKNQEKFQWLWFHINQLDKEYEVERFINLFWKNIIDNQDFSLIEELKNIWFYEFEERMKSRNISKDSLIKDFNKNSKRYILTEFNEYSFNLEEDKFISKFWEEYEKLTMMNKEKLVFFWFEDFLEEINKLNWDYKNLMNAYTKINRNIYKKIKN